jgi:hypothetical protein
MKMFNLTLTYNIKMYQVECDFIRWEEAQKKKELNDRFEREHPR